MLGCVGIGVAGPKEQFLAQRNWKFHGEVKAAAKKINVVKKGEDVIGNVSDAGKSLRAPFLITKNKFRDVHMEMEFMIPKGSNSGVYFMGRYEIQILDSFGKAKAGAGDLGGLYQRWDKARNPKGFEGVAPKLNAAKPAGEWQKMEVVFRAPRFSKDGTKTHHAKFLKVLVNDKLVHENQVAKGPTRAGKFNGETGDAAPIMIQGDHGPIAIRKMSLKVLELSTEGEPPLAGAEMTPLDDQGRPQVNAVAYGKELFTAKGCAECHATAVGEIKTGPSLHGLFTKDGRKTKVYIPAEGHKKEIPADLQYLKTSLRRSAEELAYQAEDKPYLPVMPPYGFKLINDDDVNALHAYFKTLNGDKDAGAPVVWVKKPSVKYVLKDDPIAVLVKSYPRLERVDMGEHLSARAYHVGLPGDFNYSFDPRTMSIAQVWDGPFLVSKDKVNRGKGGAKRGFNHRDYKINNLLQPYDAQGQLVDLNYVSPGQLFNPPQAKKFLNDTTDFLETAKSFPATFLGVDTPKKVIPTFRYVVGENKIALKFNIIKGGLIEVTLDLDLKTEQQLAIPIARSSVPEVSLGKLHGPKWTLPAGQYKDVKLTATLFKQAGELYTSDIQKVESDAPQKLTWKPSSKKAKLPPGYSIEDGSAPKGRFGRQLVFEPMGIEFHQGEAYVTTRTAGIWKVVNGHWQLFAEGAYDSLGLVVKSKNEVIIGEKPGLTRLIDADGDHWAERRENITDKFRFNGGYHEYLHGPIKYNGSYLFSLNLGHEMKGIYKAGGSYMGTAGGLRGWMLSTDEQGNTGRFARGFRSPAGLALSPKNEIIYTENQGEYVGTSKVFKVKKGAFYGNPTGLVDLVGKNVDSPEITWDAVKEQREQPLLLLPHNEVMNAPGSPEFLTEKIKFGPFQGQMFLGDQMQSNIYRVDTQMVDGVEQGVAIPFAEGLKSGVMRLRFNPADSSLWIGQTGRGWRAKGGSADALQRIVFDPAMKVDGIKSVKVTPEGFDVHFAHEQPESDETGKVSCSSWYYQNSAKYGSPVEGMRNEVISAATWSEDKTILRLKLKDFKVSKKADSTDSSRVYRINLEKTGFGIKHGPFLSKAYYTLHRIPVK